MPLVVITGGLGCGKSTVLETLRDLGLRTADADTIVHALYRRGESTWRMMVARWGGGILDSQQEIKRQAVADIVFQNPTERLWLEGITHPKVRERILTLEQQEPSPLYVAIPLYDEAGWELPAARIVCVWCTPSLQRQRLRQRGWDDQEIDRRLACQIAPDEKLKRAEFTLVNNYSKEILLSQCRQMVAEIGRTPQKGH